MAITFDPAKRDKTLAERGLDFADAEEVFASLLTENPDDRFDYVRSGGSRSDCCGAEWLWWSGLGAAGTATSSR